MTKRTLAFASLAVIGAITAAAVWAGMRLPGQLPLPVHWNWRGEPDRFAGKWMALLLPALVASGISIFLYFVPQLEPRRQGLSRSLPLYLSVWAGLLIVCAFAELAVISVAFRWSIHGTAFILGGIGALFGLIGNQLGKSRSMYLIGFRTPWTLASEEVWMKTNRLAGKLMVCGGSLLVLTALLRIPSGVIAAIFGSIIAVVLGIPLAYSYFLWRRQTGHQ